MTLPDSVPELTLGWNAIHWATKYLRQPDGDQAGERWHFTGSQVRFILHWYAIEPDDSRQGWRWVYNHGVRRLPKGSGKSPFAGALALIELLAPVRFKSWDDTKPGGIIGKRVSMPLVQIAGVAESSAMINTMRMVTALAPKGSRLAGDHDLELGKTIIYTGNNGQLHIITNSAAAAEGAQTTFAIMDQTENWRTGNGGDQLARVIRRNLRKSGNRTVETCNAWEPGQNSVAEQAFSAWVNEETDRTRGTARTLMDIRMAPPVKMTDSIEKLIAAVEFAYGDCHWINARDIVENGILDLKTSVSESKRFYFNWPSIADNAWADPQDWKTMANEDFYIPYGDDIAIGFDGSRTRDATAMIGCHIETGYTFVIGIWKPVKSTKSTPGIPVPVHEVDAALEQANKDYNIVGFLADVREWESFTKIDWPKRFAENLVIEAVPGGQQPEPIAWDMRTHVRQFTQAAEMVLAEIKGHRFQHDGDTRLRDHVANSREYPNQYGTSISKQSPDSDEKIDGAAAMILARHARRLVLSSPDYAPGTKKRRGRQKVAGNVWSYS